MTACKIDIAQLYGLGQSAQNTVRPGYGDPQGPPADFEDADIDSAWSVQLHVNGERYQLCWFLASESMSITYTNGERGSATFTLCDYDAERQIIPLIPPEEAYCEIWNRDENYLYFAGYVRDVDQTLLEVRADGTEAASYTVTLTDLYHELERKPVRKLYVSKTLGFILRDVITRWTTLDASEIDPALGFVVNSYPVNAKTPAQVLDHILALTNTTYLIDPATRKLKLLAKDDGAARYPVTITDGNLYDYFDRDTFKLRRQNDLIQNQIELWFNDKYSKGTVNVENGSNIVVAHGMDPETDWDNLPANLQFKLAGSDAVYTIQKNNSAGAVQELILSSNFAESTATNQAYEIRGNRRRVYVSDETSIAGMRNLGRGDGIFTYVVSEDNNFFTFNEARRFAAGLLALSRPLPQGNGTTYTDTWSWQPLLAGMLIPFNLPNSKRFVGDVLVQQVTITDLGGWTEAEENVLGQRHPYCRIDFNFTATLNAWQTQTRKMMQSLTKVKIDLEQEADIEDYRRIPELMAVRDCLHVSEPAPVADSLVVADAIAVRIESGDPPAYYELDFYLNDLDYAFYSD